MFKFLNKLCYKIFLYDNIPISGGHLRYIIDKHIKKYGNECDLNHIDISKVSNLSHLFSNSQFNGGISQWNTGKVTDMSYMFYHSSFNVNISQWDTSEVTNIESMFAFSPFNQDISNWNTGKVENMNHMFENSVFNQDISMWNGHKIIKNERYDYAYDMFLNNHINIYHKPIWALSEKEFKIIQEQTQFIEELHSTLDNKKPPKHKTIKI